MSDFHMVVCVKAVPGSTEVKMDPKTNTIVRDGKQAVINPFDASALECALALKDDFIGFGMDVRVTVVSMGIPATESLLRDCIARGADDALLLTDRAFAGADTLATTYALKCGIEALDEDFDLLICGKMAVDGDTAQIGPELAGAFEIPCVTDVSCVQSAGFANCGSLATPRAAALPARRHRSCDRLCPTATKHARPLAERRPSRRQNLPRLSRGWHR